MPKITKFKKLDDQKLFIEYDDGISGEYSLKNTNKTTKCEIKLDDKSGDILVDEINICKDALYKQLSMRALMNRLKIDLDKV